MITTNIITAAQALKNEDIIAIPTETVYGLAGNAYSENALKKIFELKQRPFYNPLIVHIKSAEFLNIVASDIPDMAWKLAEEFWPGPLTLVLKKQSHIPDLVTAGNETVAVRVPNHSLTLELLEQLEFPLAAPSANPFGSISPTSAEHVSAYFEEDLEIVLDGGECQKGIESTIIGFESDIPILYRHGSISVEAIEKVVGKVKIVTNNNSKPDAPGMLSRHYAPKTQTLLADNVKELIKLNRDKKIGLLLYKDRMMESQNILQEVLSKTGDLTEATKNLYAAMHRLDKSNLDVIIAERLPNQGLGKSINDRLERATKQ